MEMLKYNKYPNNVFKYSTKLQSAYFPTLLSENIPLHILNIRVIEVPINVYSVSIFAETALNSVAARVL